MLIDYDNNIQSILQIPPQKTVFYFTFIYIRMFV
jgi:hypothetical protein